MQSVVQGHYADESYLYSTSFIKQLEMPLKAHSARETTVSKIVVRTALCIFAVLLVNKKK